MEGEAIARRELSAKEGEMPPAACISCSRCSTEPYTTETIQEEHPRAGAARDSGECEKLVSGSTSLALTLAILAAITCCPVASGFVPSHGKCVMSHGSMTGLPVRGAESQSTPCGTWWDMCRRAHGARAARAGVSMEASANGGSGYGDEICWSDDPAERERNGEARAESPLKSTRSSSVRGASVVKGASSHAPPSAGKATSSKKSATFSGFSGFSGSSGPFRPWTEDPPTCPAPVPSASRVDTSLSVHSSAAGTPAGEHDTSGMQPGDDSVPSPRRISAFRWVSKRLKRKVGWGRAGAGAGVAVRPRGVRGSFARRVFSDERTGSSRVSEGVEVRDGFVEARDMDGVEDRPRGMEDWTWGWSLSGWGNDAGKPAREKRNGGGPGLMWGSTNNNKSSNKWGGRQLWVEKGFDDFHLRTVAKIHSLLGREDEAEEMMLKMIRDPYLLGDASWVPGSVDETAEWKRLEVHHKKISTKHLKDVINDPERSLALSAEYEGTILDYSRMNVSQLTMKLLYDLAKRQGLKEKIQAMFNGEKINNTEDRAVLHVALRMDKDHEAIMVDGVNVVEQVHDTLDKVKAFAEAVRAGRLRGATNKLLRNIVAVGIGGSYLGPEFVHEAFKTQEYNGREQAELYRLRFLSNVDPVDVRRTLYDLDPEETLVVVISKTFTTAETMLNARTARQWLWDSMGKDPKVVQKHMAACASESASQKVTDFGIPTDRLFPLWDWVGGRYSVCSSVGALPLSLKYGFQAFENFLAGARSMDKHFLHAPLEKNIPVLMGLLGVWNMSFMGYKTRTILPYAEALLKFPAHIQQLAMESNGKRVTRNGQRVSYDIGQVDFGEPGTNGQHSFFQLLHMGQVCPAEFIGFIESQHPLHVEGESVCSHDELMANFFAQPDALAVGKGKEELAKEGCKPDLIPHRTFDGNRPSLSLLVPKVNSYHLGQLLALYEHRTAVEGFMWDINSFDQWGVELGKSLATRVRQKMHMFRTDGQEATATKGFNPSTQRLMSRYLQQSDSFVRRVGNVNHRSKKRERRQH